MYKGILFNLIFYYLIMILVFVIDLFTVLIIFINQFLCFSSNLAAFEFFDKNTKITFMFKKDIFIVSIIYNNSFS